MTSTGAQMKGKRGLVLAVIVSAACITAACGRYSSTPASAGPSQSAAAVAYAMPPGRQAAAMAYDPEMRKVVMFGGGTISTPLNDTWAWDGKGWTDLHPATTPAGSAASMVYDTADHQLVLDTSGQLGSSIWTWKNGDWVLLRAYPARTCEKLAGGGVSCSPPIATSPEGFESAVYDAALGKLVAQDRLDTWAGDGLNWTRLGSLDDTLGNCFCIAYDSVTRQLVTLAFSGGKSAPAIGHTLVLGQAGWMRSQAVTPVVTQALIVDDPAASILLMLSVNENYGSPQPEQMWSWNGSSWTQIKVSLPPLLNGSSISYDAGHKQVVLYGGIDVSGTAYSDTWTWDGKSWQKRV